MGRGPTSHTVGLHRRCTEPAERGGGRGWRVRRLDKPKQGCVEHYIHTLSTLCTQKRESRVIAATEVSRDTGMEQWELPEVREIARPTAWL